jgi:hypothetical protein
MDFKVKNEFIALSNDHLFPGQESFNNLKTADQLSKNWYITLNINFRGEQVNKKISDIKDKLVMVEHNKSSLRPQPGFDLHCSLLNVLKIETREIAEEIAKEEKRDLMKVFKEVFDKKREFCADFIYKSNESMALQIFVEPELINKLEEIKKKLERKKLFYLKKFPDIGWDNKIKLNPKEKNYLGIKWGAMNLVRYKKESLSESLSEGLSKYVREFNKEAKEKRKKEFYVEFKAKPSLVISDHLFGEKSEIIFK